MGRTKLILKFAAVEGGEVLMAHKAIAIEVERNTPVELRAVGGSEQELDVDAWPRFERHEQVLVMAFVRRFLPISSLHILEQPPPEIH